jgi:hypothetical protein
MITVELWSSESLDGRVRVRSQFRTGEGEWARRRSLAIAVPVLLVLQACASTVGERVPTPLPRPSSGAVFALLADNSLAVVSEYSAVARIEELGSSATQSQQPAHIAAGHYLAISTDKRSVFVLVGGATTPARVAIVDATNGRLAKTFALDPMITFRSLAVGKRTGRIFLFGNRSPGPDHSGEDVVAAAFDPESGRMEASWTIRPANGRDWFVYQGGVSPDELHLYVSYHGPDTTGIDVFDPASSRLECTVGNYGTGCIQSHGGFALDANHIVAATGGSEMIETTPTGQIEYRFDTGLANNHLMEFTIDWSAQVLFAAGSCRYVAGFRALRISSGTRHPLVSTNDYRVCGERSALGPDSQIVIGKIDALLFVDQSTGQIMRTVATPAEPVDVIYV